MMRQIVGVRLSETEKQALMDWMRAEARPHVSEAVREILRQELQRRGFLAKAIENRTGENR